MYAIKSTQRGDDVQSRIIQACIESLGTGCLWENLSVVDLCKAVGISRKTFYRNFECKDDAVELMLDQFIASICARGGFMEMLEAFEQQRAFMDIVARNNWYGLLREKWQQFDTLSRPDYTHQMFSTYQAEKTDMIYSFYISGYVTTMIEWHRNGFQIPRKEIAELLDLMCAQDMFRNPHLKKLKLETIHLDKFSKP